MTTPVDDVARTGGAVGPLVVRAGGEPTDEEMAAIAGAASALLLTPAGAAEPEPPVSRWRFSGRWWSKPLPLRRGRP